MGINVNGECRRSPKYHERHSDCWCGKHPDFPEWLESWRAAQRKPAAETPIEPPAVPE
jgi:hypothetical protein